MILYWSTCKHLHLSPDVLLILAGTCTDTAREDAWICPHEES